jgi:type IV pilus assembly protein PilM
MSILSGVPNFFGLDIGTTAIRVVELSGNGPVKTLARYGSAPVDIKISQSDAKADQQRLMQAVQELLGKTGISSKNVAVGLPSQKVLLQL